MRAVATALQKFESCRAGKLFLAQKKEWAEEEEEEQKERKKKKGLKRNRNLTCMAYEPLSVLSQTVNNNPESRK